MGGLSNLENAHIPASLKLVWAVGYCCTPICYTHPCNFLTLQAVDVVGQAGKPKTITGFQTHTTPVLLAHGERAELATEEFLPVTPILEGFVILRKNPNYDL